MSYILKETDDFQNRRGEYPRSGVPDTVNIYNDEAVLSFKNTSESFAKAWTQNHLNKIGQDWNHIDAFQDGDYNDDWVTVVVKLNK